MKYSQWQEAAKATQALQLRAGDTAIQRYSYYQKLLGRTDAQIAGSHPAARRPRCRQPREACSFSQADLGSEPQLQLDPIDPQIAQDATSVSDGEIKTLSSNEVTELDEARARARLPDRGERARSRSVPALGSFHSSRRMRSRWVAAPPSISAGRHLHAMASGLAAVSRAIGETSTRYEATKAGKLGSYARRETGWTFQSNSAKGEINQILKQLRGAQIREAIAKKEYDNHQVQMANAQQIVDFLQGNGVGGNIPDEGNHGRLLHAAEASSSKSSTAMRSSSPTTRRARPSARCSTSWAIPRSTFIQFNYLDGAEGLLAGEKLAFDVKAMEMAYHDLQPARIRADQPRQPDAGRSARTADVARDRELHLHHAGGAVRSRRPGALFPPHPLSRRHGTVRGRALYQRQSARSRCSRARSAPVPIPARFTRGRVRTMRASPTITAPSSRS